MRPAAKTSSGHLSLLLLITAGLLCLSACDDPARVQGSGDGNTVSGYHEDSSLPLPLRIEKQLEKKQWQAAARKTADSEQQLGASYKPLLRKVLRQFFIKAVNEGSEDEKFSVATTVVELRDANLEHQMRTALKAQQNPRMLEQARWRTLWDNYLKSPRLADPIKTFDQYIVQIPEAGGHYVRPVKEEVIKVNRAINYAKQKHRAEFRRVEPLLKQGDKNTLFYLVDSMFQNPHRDLLPWMVLLMNHQDPIISSRAIMALGRLNTPLARRRLLHFVTGNRALINRLFAARILWQSVKLPHTPAVEPNHEKDNIRVIPGGAKHITPKTKTTTTPPENTP